MFARPTRPKKTRTDGFPRKFDVRSKGETTFTRRSSLMNQIQRRGGKACNFPAWRARHELSRPRCCAKHPCAVGSQLNFLPYTRQSKGVYNLLIARLHTPRRRSGRRGGSLVCAHFARGCERFPGRNSEKKWERGREKGKAENKESRPLTSLLREPLLNLWKRIEHVARINKLPLTLNHV